MSATVLRTAVSTHQPQASHKRTSLIRVAVLHRLRDVRTGVVRIRQWLQSDVRLRFDFGGGKKETTSTLLGNSAEDWEVVCW